MCVCMCVHPYDVSLFPLIQVTASFIHANENVLAVDGANISMSAG